MARVLVKGIEWADWKLLALVAWLIDLPSAQGSKCCPKKFERHSSLSPGWHCSVEKPLRNWKSATERYYPGQSDVAIRMSSSRCVWNILTVKFAIREKSINATRLLLQVGADANLTYGSWETWVKSSKISKLYSSDHPVVHSIRHSIQGMLMPCDCS